MYINFERELEYVKKDIREEDIDKVIKDVRMLNDYINEMKNKGFSLSEILDMMNDDIITTFTIMTKNSGTEKLQRESYSLGMLINNPMLLEKIYEEVKDIDLSDYNVKIEQELNDREEELWQRFVVKLNLKFLRNLKLEEKYGEQFDEKSLLILYMKKRREDTNNEIKKRYVALLVNAGNFMRKYQFLNNDLKLYNQDMRSLALHDMMYVLEKKDKKDKDDLSLEEIFSSEYLEKLSLDQLSALNLFWQNRLTKSLEKMINGIFMKKHVKVEQGQDLENKLRQNIYRKEICLNIYKKVSKTLAKGKKYTRYKIDENNPDFIEEYNKYFDGELSQNGTDFIKDISDIAVYENVQINAYKVKCDMLKMLLQNTLKYNSKISNWGVIEERKPKNGFYLIGIDFPGLNFPIKVHMRKGDLKYFLNYINGNSIVPIYRGNDDFIYENKRIASHILVLLTREKEGVIIKKASESIPIDMRYLLYQHLGNLVTVKTKKVKKIRTERYIDLETGKRGVMERGVFVEELVHSYKEILERDF